MLTLIHASAESAFVKTDISYYLFGYFGQWSPTSLQVKQRFSCCNLAIFSQVSLVALLQAGRMTVGFDATKKERLYTKLARHFLQLAYWPTVFVLVLVFVFAPWYWLPLKLATGV